MSNFVLSFYLKELERKKQITFVQSISRKLHLTKRIKKEKVAFEINQKKSKDISSILIFQLI